MLDERGRDGRPVILGFDRGAFQADRLASGYSLTRLAAATGVGRETLGGWERGEHFPSRRLFPRVLDVLWRDL